MALIRTMLNGIRPSSISWVNLLLSWSLLWGTLGVEKSVASRLYSVEENRPKQELGKIPTDFNLFARFSAGELSSLRYAVLSQTGAHAAFFFVHPESGVLSTTQSLDREAFCDWIVECILNVDIGIYSKSVFDVIKAEVMITDVNDVAPAFPEADTHVTVPESSRINDQFVLPIAIDRDSKGPNSDIEYNLGANNGVFDIVVTKDDGTVSDVSLALRGELDREKLDNYQMVLIAVDRGKPRLTGSMIVSVSVGDVNDHKPVFHKQRYEVTVPENEEEGKVLVKVHARDLDKGDNAKIRYRISSRPDKNVKEYLTLNEQSGEVIVKRKIDYEKVKRFQFKVEARDTGAQPLKSYTNVVINVRDLNDNSPVVHVNYLFQKDKAEITENSYFGSLVAHFSVSDLDSGERKEVYCKLHDTNFRLKSMGGNMYQILLNTEVDREQLEQYTVKVTCIDKGRPPKSITETIPVKVIDENDERPRFKQRKYEGYIAENSKPGTPLLKVSAEDKDIGLNGEIGYSIKGTDRFVVDTLTGEITSSGDLNREETPKISFNVYAWDKGDSPLSDVTRVVVDVLDENDEAPIFASQHYTFRINEKDTGVIGRVNATDRDSGKGGEVTYTIPRYEEGAFFTISPNNGAIRAKVILDTIIKREYNFAVKASDGGQPIRWSKTKVTVLVEDINDNKPIISSLPNNGTLEVPYNVRSGFLATTVIARDADSGRNGELSYSLQSSCAGCFEVNRQGNLYVRRLKPNVRVYTVIVTVKDNGIPSLSDSTNITIFVVKPHMMNKDLGRYGNNDKHGAGMKGENLMIVVGVVVGTVVICGIIVTLICILRHTHSSPPTPVKTHADDLVDAKFSDTPENHANLRPPGCTYKSFRCDSNGEDKLTADMDKNVVTDGQYQLLCRAKPTWNMDSPRHERNVCPVPPLQHTDDYNRTLSHMNTFQLSPNRRLPPSYNSTINIPLVSHKPQPLNNDTKRANSHGNLNQQLALYNELRHMRPEDDHSDTSRDTSNSDSGKGGSEEDGHAASLPRESHVTLADPSCQFGSKGVYPDYV